MPDHLVPLYSLRNHITLQADGKLVVNPDCWFDQDKKLPADVAEAIAPFDLQDQQDSFVCVRNIGNRILQPFSLEPEISGQLTKAGPGGAAPPNLPPAARAILVSAGILVDVSRIKKCRQDWETAIDRGAAEFKQRGFVPVRQLIHPFHVSALRTYYRHLALSGQMKMGDHQCSRRYIAHNDPVAKFFHRQLTPLMSRFAGEPVKPSYVYVASYQEGAVLNKHLDREQCEFSVTLNIDYAPEPRIATAWPLRLHADSGTITVFQALGDALLYRGCQIAHSRNALPAGHTSTSIFLHYVRENFDGDLN